MRLAAIAVLSLLALQGWPLKGPQSCDGTDKATGIDSSGTLTCGADESGEGGGVPAGLAAISFSGACPSGWSEVAGASGKFLLGTVNANADQGGTGGSDNITPAGTNSGGAVSAHAGTAVADHASHTHTYTEVPNHVHPYCSQTATTGSVSSYEHGAIDTSSAKTECSETTNNPTGGVATGTTAGPSATLTHSVTQPSNHTFTQPTFAGTEFDNRPAFVRVIFCSKD